MLELHQREACPFCTKVRRALERHNIRYVAVPVPKLGSERSETTALPGVTSAEVPVLVDGDKVIQGSDAILEHIGSLHSADSYGDPGYGLTRRLTKTTYAGAVEAVKAALAAEGFGVLTEIDVQSTLKKKIDVDFRRYVILGACNPGLAHQALSAEPGLGLLLPCNVVVTEEEDGSVVVSAIDPLQMFRVVENKALEPVAKEVKAKLGRALAAVWPLPSQNPQMP